MTSRPHESLAASLCALCLALITAGLVLWGERTPWEAMVIVVAGTLFVVAFGLVSLLWLAGNRSNRERLRNIFMHTVKTDLQPIVELWKLLRGRRR
jgi:TRAP-type C4-dicarboxylate transport system permease large subunit